uniref:Uncharacterized protein n=1 Tax=Babesia bovis TaxID=5865 RepID=A7ATJ7_BABBO|eukprot:XP_001609826.1 hypothetical protein [Babesia bovis T2Bo]
MAFTPSQAAHSAVQRVLDSIKKQAEERALRHSRAKLKGDSTALSSRSYVRKSNNGISPKVVYNVQQRARSTGDYFTRLVNSSPKPRVLRSANHPVAIHLYKLAHSAAYRKYRKLVLLTSTKLIREYCERHGACSRIYTTSYENPVLLEPSVRAERVIVCSDKLLQKVADLHSYKGGVVAEVPYPQPAQHLGQAALVLCVAPKCNAARDNGATATLVRTAHALQWQALWMLKHGEHDLLNPRDIRASQNCLDTMPYVVGTAQEAIKFAKDNDLLISICCDGGFNLNSDRAQNIIKQHRGMLLLIGKQPKVGTILK